MSYKCELTELTAQPTVVVRATANFHTLPHTIRDGFTALDGYLKSVNEQPAGPWYVAYHNNDMDHMDVEVGIPVSRELPGTDGIAAGVLPAGRAAATMHRGPYHDGAHAWSALEHWIADQGLQVAGPSYERYLNDPDHTTPDALLTRMEIPVR
jgi:effector-binding domain-containing protein